MKTRIKSKTDQKMIKRTLVLVFGYRKVADADLSSFLCGEVHITAWSLMVFGHIIPVKLGTFFCHSNKYCTNHVRGEQNAFEGINS